jgi:hypothetical protein
LHPDLNPVADLTLAWLQQQSPFQKVLQGRIVFGVGSNRYGRVFSSSSVVSRLTSHSSSRRTSLFHL